MRGEARWGNEGTEKCGGARSTTAMCGCHWPLRPREWNAMRKCEYVHNSASVAQCDRADGWTDGVETEAVAADEKRSGKCILQSH